MIEKGSVLWVLETDVFDKEEDARLINAVVNAGQTIYTVDSSFNILAVDGQEVPCKDEFMGKETEFRFFLGNSELVTGHPENYPLIFRGSLKSCREFNKIFNHSPGTFCDDFSSFDYLSWASKINRNILINDTVIPFGWLGDYCKRENIDALFAKSNRCGLLNGMVYRNEAITDLIENSNLPKETLLIVSEETALSNEVRGLVVNDVLVGVSEYINEKGFKWIKEADEVNPLFYHIIKVLREEGFVDTYTIDIVKSGNLWYLLEINSFAAAALYAMNLNNVVKAVSKSAVEIWKEFS